MNVFLTSVGLFLGAFVFHLILWRCKLPKHQMKALLIIFATVFCLWLPAAFLLSFGAFPGLHVALFYGSMSLCYVITYSAIEADSPTLSLILFLSESKSTGRSASEVSQFMARRPFIKARLAALVLSGLIREDGSRLVVTGPQPWAFRVILGYRTLYGRIERGG